MIHTVEWKELRPGDHLVFTVEVEEIVHATDGRIAVNLKMRPVLPKSFILRPDGSSVEVSTHPIDPLR